MTRSSEVLSAALAAAIGVLSPALAQDALSRSADAQLAAAAGLTPDEASPLTLGEIAVYKFNRDSRDENAPIRIEPDTATTVDPQRHTQLILSAGLDPTAVGGMSLNDVFGYKIDVDNADDNRAAPVGRRSAGAVDAVAHAQLIAAAGLTPAEAEGLTLGELAELKARGDSGW